MPFFVDPANQYPYQADCSIQEKHELEILGDKKVACEKLNNEGVVRCYCTEDECNSKEMVNNWIHENAEGK